MERSNFVIKIISVVASIAIVCYIGYYFIDARINPLSTAPATLCTLENSETISGHVVRSETVLSGGGDSVVLSADDGDKLAVGEIIASKYRTQEAIECVSSIRDTELKIEQLENMLLNFSDTAGNEHALNSVLNLSYAVKSGDFKNLDALALELETHIFESYSYRSSKELENAIAELEQELVALQAAASNDIEFISATFSGIFSSVVDGYENISPEDLNENMTPADVEKLFSAKESVPENTLGKIVSGMKWYYVTTVDTVHAQKLEPGDTAEMRFSKNYTNTIDMKVELIGPETDGEQVVVFSTNKYLSDTVSIRSMTADIIFSSISGIRVPQEAMHRDTEGKAFVYLLSGLQAEQVYVEIIGESDDFYVVKKDPSGAIRDGSEIIVSAKDLYDGKVIQ